MKNKNTQKSRIVRVSRLLMLLMVSILLLYWLFAGTRTSFGKKDEAVLSPTQIESIRAIGQWEFLTIRDEEVGDLHRNGFFRDDVLVRIYHGTLRLGIDMNDVEENWITAEGDSIHVLLPPVRLLSEDFLDEADAQAFYEVGTWSQADRKKLAEQVRKKMLDRCLTPQNIVAAERNASAQFDHLLRSMGFKKVSVRFKKDS